MVQQVVRIPDEDLSLFLELAKKFKWKIMSNTSTMQEPVIDYVLTSEQIVILEESAKVPTNLCLSAEESLRKLDEL